MVSTESFHPFPRLPTELRLQIWGTATSNWNTPSLIKINIDTVNWVITGFSSPLPGILAATHESRSAALPFCVRIESQCENSLPFSGRILSETPKYCGYIVKGSSITLLELDFRPEYRQADWDDYSNAITWEHIDEIVPEVLGLAEHLHLRCDNLSMLNQLWNDGGFPGYTGLSSVFQSLESLKMVTESRKAVQEINTNGDTYWCEVHRLQSCSTGTGSCYFSRDFQAYRPYWDFSFWTWIQRDEMKRLGAPESNKGDEEDEHEEDELERSADRLKLSGKVQLPIPDDVIEQAERRRQEITSSRRH
ncbi:hypothetical protein BDV96DRAFT_156625 [Lophiotrema nucula]|uniref:2EXR domain-containing protein n=1 Tax=Lophiotrema nucula TaxID=690887 RepID=A0A6A5Z111_9PLEO|nr:hypothetical protein BDV96DRAFT_156625 [Lophiotrema nucula]